MFIRLVTASHTRHSCRTLGRRNACTLFVLPYLRFPFQLCWFKAHTVSDTLRKEDPLPPTAPYERKQQLFIELWSTKKHALRVHLILNTLWRAWGNIAKPLAHTRYKTFNYYWALHTIIIFPNYTLSTVKLSVTVRKRLFSSSNCSMVSCRSAYWASKRMSSTWR